MLFEEFETERAWWGDEETDFAKRVETEYAWKVDFKAEKEEAFAKAKPHYEKHAKLEKDIEDCTVQIKSLTQENKDRNTQVRKNAASKKELDAIERQVRDNDTEISNLRKRVTKVDRQAKDEKAAGDRLKYAVYNLDRKNPHTTTEEVLDPDKLLQEYKELQEAIVQTQKLLKDELAAALLRGVE